MILPLLTDHCPLGTSSTFSEEQVRRMLGLESCWDAREVLSKHGVWPGTTVEEILRDAETAAAFSTPSR